MGIGGSVGQKRRHKGYPFADRSGDLAENWEGGSTDDATSTMLDRGPMTTRPVAVAMAVLLLLAIVLIRGAGGDANLVVILVKSRAPLTPDVAQAIVSAVGGQVLYYWPEIDAMAIRMTSGDVGALSDHPLVAYAGPDRQVYGIPDAGGGADPTADLASQSTSPLIPWNLDMADVTGTGYDGTGVTIAILDSGLPQNWREFLPVGSVDLTHAAGFGAEGAGDFHNPLIPIVGEGGIFGLHPHGLAVSSVIVGFPSEFGPIAGAAPGATILPIRILNQFNFGWFSWFIAGFLYVANLKTTGVLTGPVVINFSIQAMADDPILAEAILYAISQGVLVVTIAGNFGPAPCSLAFPGRLPQAITVGAVGWTAGGFFGDVPEDDPSQVFVAPFSGRDCPGLTRVDVVAPGADIFGLWLYGPGFSENRERAFPYIDYVIWGTSFAAPHVAGTLAQMLQKNPGLTQAEAEALVQGTALPLPGEAVEAVGAGLVQGDAAVAATAAP